MKKYLTLILLLMFIVTGCSNKETKKESSKPQEQRIDKAKFGVEYEWDCEVPLSNIKEFYYQDFLTTDGDFYAYDLYKIFSTTNSHCKKEYFCRSLDSNCS